MRWQTQLDKKYHGLIPVITILIGIIIGSLIANGIWHQNPEYLQPLIMDEYYGSVLRNYRERVFYWRFLISRAGMIFGFVVLYQVLHWNLIAYFALGMIGFSWGFLISIEILKNGIQGLFYGGLGIWLHSVLYGLAIYQWVTVDDYKSKVRIYLLAILLALIALMSEFWLEPLLIVRFYQP